MVLLDTRVLVVDMQRGDATAGNHSRTKLARGAAADSTIKNQLHLTGPADIQILPNDFLEEGPPGDRAVQNLGERKLGLQNRDLLPVTGLPIFGGKWVRQLAEPFPQ